MSGTTDLRDLEQRLAQTLHATAPRPSAGDIDRLLRTAVASPQRRRPFGLSFAPVLAAASMVALAVVVGLGIGGLLNRGPSPGDPSATPVPTVSPSASPSATPSPTARPPSPSPASVFPGGDASCENESIGFTVTYPADWWANEVVDDDPAGDPIPACLYFSEEPLELIQNAGLPRGIAIIAALEDEPAGNPEQPIEVVSSREVVVDGLPATAEEIEWTEDTGFQRDGDRSYGYRIPLPDGRVLLIGTSNQPPSEEYQLRMDVLDRMMERMDLTGS
jgi:hypothetical protein